MSAKSFMAIVLALAVQGGVDGQSSVGDAMNPLVTRVSDPQVFLSMAENVSSYSTVVEGAFPEQYVMAFLSNSNLPYEMPVAVGLSVQMGIWAPVGFVLGLSDANGSMRVEFPKPTVPLGVGEGVTMYAQVVAVSYNATGNPSIAMVPSNVVPFTLRRDGHLANSDS